MNMNPRISVTQLNDHIYLMDDNHESTGYIVVGKDKALVIDTMYGIEDVKEVVRRYTDLPIMVVNTHGHPDHIFGNIYFDEAYLNPDDWYAATEVCLDPDFKKMADEKGLKMPPFKDILPGDIIDLGGLHLEVISLPGHTPGSILLLLKEDRILFTGDAINHHLWMQLHHSVSLELFRDNLKKIMYLTDQADRILHSHARDFDDISLMNKNLAAIEEILDGNTDGDEDYHWFGGLSKTHPIPDDDGVICFNPVEERVRKMRRDWAENDAKRDAGLIEPEDIIKYRNISYNIFGKDSLLDVYEPECDGKLPVLINVHGGAYFYGDKELYRFYCMDMAGRGFAVVGFNYRLSPEYRFPAAIQDINEVMRWVESHADEYNMDTDRVFMMGDSAGAQLASHYAALLSNPEFASLYALKPHGLKIKGISLACGMYDIPNVMTRESEKDLFKDYLGENYDVKNPMLDVCHAITADYPETYIFSCPNDFLYEHCEPMAKLINSRGGRAVCKIYGTSEMKDVGHVFNCDFRLPIGEEARKDQAEFLLGLK